MGEPGPSGSHKSQLDKADDTVNGILYLAKGKYKAFSDNEPVVVNDESDLRKTQIATDHKAAKELQRRLGVMDSLECNTVTDLQNRIKEIERQKEQIEKNQTEYLQCMSKE